MLRRRKPHGFTNLPTSFLDKLLILILVFLAIAILALILINPIVKKKDIDTKAEFIIDMEWGKGDHDVDIWIEDPIGSMLSYRRQEAGLLNLDRDDTGVQRDFFEVDGEKIYVEGNHETVTARGILPGIYVVNIHLYRAGKVALAYVEIEDPVKVKVRLTKVNPKVKTYFERTVELTHTKEERHVFSFEITKEGDIIDVNTDSGYTLVYAESSGPAFFNDGTGLPFAEPVVTPTSDDRPSTNYERGEGSNPAFRNVPRQPRTDLGSGNP